jgi:hypothetical protein
MNSDLASDPGSEAAQETAQDLVNDLFRKIDNWCIDVDRTEGQMPLEQIMYDAGPVWIHQNVPKAEPGREQMGDRLMKIIPALAELAPAAAAACFNAESRLFVLLHFTDANGSHLDLMELAIPAPGESLEEFERINTSFIDIDEIVRAQKG